MKTNEAPGKLNSALSEPETGVRPGHGTDWAGLVWLTLLVAAGLTGFQKLEHLLFPQLDPLQHQAMMVCLGTIAAVVGTYYSTRRLDRALALHAQSEKKLAHHHSLMLQG